jgi:hypothetical protein
MEGPLAYRETLTIEHQFGELGWYGGPTIDPDEAPYERIPSPSIDSTRSLEPEPEVQPIVPSTLTQSKASNGLGRRASKYGKKAMQGLFNMHKRARVDEAEARKVKHQKQHNVSFSQILTLRFKLEKMLQIVQYRLCHQP